ncbi:hypothetical protein [Chitinophaga sp. MM2321]|uniref:hypothetical protein n=1 Tax=Chitinophaga sp. MM2321 TaxID=3137178 RepID=UPI0032D5A78F
MKFIFRKPPETPKGNFSVIQNRIGQKVQSGTERSMHRLSDVLQKKTRHYSRKKKVVLLIILMIVLSAYNVWLMTRIFYIPHRQKFDISTILAPLKISPGVTGTDSVYQGITNEEYQRIMQFKNYLDSLAGNKRTRPEYNRILLSRPGLKDSLNLFEYLYKAQKKMVNPNDQIVNPNN